MTNNSISSTVKAASSSAGRPNETSVPSEPPVRSPCVHVCALDENDICIACHRSGMEITQWGALDNAGKRAVLAKVARRERGEAVE